MHISDVPRGLACACVCVDCGEPLLARKGSKRRAHFAHANPTACSGGAETALHLIAKELMSKIRHIALPDYRLRLERKLRKSGVMITLHQTVTESRGLRVTRAETESREPGFTPDVTLHLVDGTRKDRMFVEIAVTNKVRRDKMRKIRKAGFPAVEIRFNLKDALLTRDEIGRKLADVTSKVWLFHPDQRTIEREFFQNVRDAIKASRLPAPVRPTAPRPARATTAIIKGKLSAEEERARQLDLSKRLAQYWKRW